MITLRSDISHTELDGELVLMDPGSGKYFGMNPTGARMFALIRERGTLAGVLDALVLEYKAPREVLERDLKKLVLELKSRGLAETDEV